MTVEATALVKGGRLELRNKRKFQEQVKRMRDGAVRVRVERVRATRSLQQSRWYWGVIVELLSDHTGYTPEEIHEVLKAKFLPKRLAVTDGNGEVQAEFVIGGSTVKLDKVEFGEYCEAVRVWAADTLGVVIPDPDTGKLWQGAP